MVPWESFKFLESQEQSLGILTELNCTIVEGEKHEGSFGLSEKSKTLLCPCSEEANGSKP